MKHKEPVIFTDFGTGMISKILSYFDEMESKEPNFYSAAEFLAHSGQKILKRVGNTEEKFKIKRIQA